MFLYAMAVMILSFFLSKNFLIGMKKTYSEDSCLTVSNSFFSMDFSDGKY